MSQEKWGRRNDHWIWNVKVTSDSVKSNLMEGEMDFRKNIFLYTERYTDKFFKDL